MSGREPDPLAFEAVAPGRSAPDEHGRRRVHPYTPFIQGVRWWPAGIVIGYSLVSRAELRIGSGALLLGLGALLGLTVIGTAVSYVSWRRLTFWFDDDGDLRVDSGVLSRQERRLQLSRLQSVDVLQPFLARLVGLAEVRVEVAGQGDSKVTLQYLTLREAQDLRNEVVARSAGVRHDAEEAPEEVLVRVPADDLALSLLLRAETFALLGLTLLVVVGAVATAGPAGLGVVLLGGVPVVTVFAQFARYFDFTVASSPDGLRLRHGLLQRTLQTVPPGRVQAVGFVQPFLWRSRGWVRVRLNVAGASARTQGSGDQSYSENVLLPVAPWPVALAIVARVLPGVDLGAVPTVPAPVRSRRRAWIQWRQLAVGWDEQVLVTRSGRVVERWDVVPHARTQSVRVTQGPWQRALGLASVHVDSTPGAVRIVGLHRDAAEARRIAQEQADRAALARAGDRSVRWVAEQHAAAAAAQPGGRILGAARPSSGGSSGSAVDADPGERPET